jgi:hypothetical protein
MKVKVTESEPEIDLNYPCLKQFPNGTIVLFVAPETGTVLRTEDRSDGTHVGEWKKDWREHLTKPFRHTVTLSNN